MPSGLSATMKSRPATRPAIISTAMCTAGPWGNIAPPRMILSRFFPNGLCGRSRQISGRALRLLIYRALRLALCRIRSHEARRTSSNAIPPAGRLTTAPSVRCTDRCARGADCVGGASPLWRLEHAHLRLVLNADSTLDVLSNRASIPSTERRRLPAPPK